MAMEAEGTFAGRGYELVAQFEAWRVDTGHAPRWGSDDPLPAFLGVPCSTASFLSFTLPYLHDEFGREATDKHMAGPLPSASCRGSWAAEHTVCSAPWWPSHGGPRFAGAMRPCLPLGFGLTCRKSSSLVCTSKRSCALPLLSLVPPN